MDFETTRYLANAPDSSNRKRVEKRLNAIRRNDYEAIRLFYVTGNLGEEFIGRDSNRRDEPKFGAYSLLYLVANLGRSSKERFTGPIKPDHP